MKTKEYDLFVLFKEIPLGQLDEFERDAFSNAITYAKGYLDAKRGETARLTRIFKFTLELEEKYNKSHRSQNEN